MTTDEKVVQFPRTATAALVDVVTGRDLMDEERIERAVAELSPREVVAFCLGAEEVKRRAAIAVRMAESRIVGEGILSPGERWDSPDGREFFWTGDRRREVADPEGLKAALEPLVVGAGELLRRAFSAAFKPMPPKVYLIELDKVARFSDEADKTIRSFVEWKEGPPHLRLVEEKPR
jgi:hypothetical protein